VPVLAAIDPNVSPDWTVYVRRCGLWLWVRVVVVFEPTVVVRDAAGCLPCSSPARTTTAPIVTAARKATGAA
jgi:hypothetical protein